MITLTQGLLLALMAFLVGFDDLMEAFFRHASDHGGNFYRYYFRGY